MWLGRSGVGPLGQPSRIRGAAFPASSPACAAPHTGLPEGETSHLQVLVHRSWAAWVSPGGPGPFSAPEFQSLVSPRWGARKPWDTECPFLAPGTPCFLGGLGAAVQHQADQISLAGPSPAEDLFPGHRYDGGLDSGFHSVDSGSKRWSGNEVRASCPWEIGGVSPGRGPLNWGPPNCRVPGRGWSCPLPSLCPASQGGAGSAKTLSLVPHRTPQAPSPHVQRGHLPSQPLPLQSTDEFSELSFRISELAREPRGPRERREDSSGE